MLAQAAQDISSVDANFVKQFMIMFAYALGLLALGGGGYMLGRKGTKGNPISIEQPLGVEATVTHAPIYAHKSELEAVKADIEHRTRENLRAQTEAAKALQTLLTAGSQREMNLMGALTEMEQRISALMSKETKEITDRLNPLCEKVASHCALIKWIQERLIQIWDGLSARLESVSKSQAEDTRRLHGRIDDAMTRPLSKSKG